MRTKEEADSLWDSIFEVAVKNKNKAVISNKQHGRAVEIPLFALATVKRAVRVLFFGSQEGDEFS